MPEIQEEGSLDPTICSNQVRTVLDEVEAHAGLEAASALEQLLIGRDISVNLHLLDLLMQESAKWASIDDLIHWARTPEGHSYWEAVNDLVGEIDF